MRYPIAVETGTEHTAWGIVVPDLPGCFSAGDTLEEALVQIEDSVLLWVQATLDAGQAIPSPTPIQTLQASRLDLTGWTWGLVKVDPTLLDEVVERIELDIPKRVLRHIDAKARASGESKSALFTRLAIQE